MTKYVMMICLFGGYPFADAYGQSGARDFLVWAQASLDYTSRSQRWGAALPGSAFSSPRTGYQQAYGLLHVYVNPTEHHRLQVGYLHGDVGTEAALRELRLRYFFLPSGTTLRPYFRLAVESVWNPPYRRGESLPSANRRLRTLLGVRYQGRVLHYVAYAEPFPTQRAGWWQEMRAYAGASYSWSKRWTVLLAYYGRYTHYLTAKWQHHIMPGIRFHLNGAIAPHPLPHHD